VITHVWSIAQGRSISRFLSNVDRKWKKITVRHLASLFVSKAKNVKNNDDDDDICAMTGEFNIPIIRNRN
jgi:hypothetical protein